jgi:two-component system chemotaxis sensor kinase CheA
MNLDSARATFFTESGEMLDEMERCLLALEDNPSDSETMNALFRSVHTVKGSSGMFGFNDVMKFTHVVENLLDSLRQGTLHFVPDMSGVLLKSHDHIQELLAFAHEKMDEPLSVGLQAEGASLVEALRSFSERPEKEDIPSPAPAAAATAADAGSGSPPKPELSDHLHHRETLNKYWHISLRPAADLFRHGMDPYSFIGYLKKIGTIKSLAVVTDSLPAVAEMDPEACYVGFEIDLSTDAPKEEISAVFDFMGDDCMIRILPPHSLIIDYVKMLRELPDSPMKLGEILVQIGTLSRHELNSALVLQGSLPAEDHTAKPLGSIIAEQGMVHPSVINAALDKQKQQNTGADQSQKKSLRIDADKLDHLINLVGELVISGANVRQLGSDRGHPDLEESVSQMTRLIEEVRNGALNIRMVQIGEIFTRYKRVVRDLSKEMGKEIELIVSGAETELDKTLIEKISDPIMHLVRNSVDHGISSPEDRVAKGKPACGTIWLNAFHETGSVVIEVRDNGEGLNKAKIREKAVAQGLLSPDREIPDQELFQMIFEPGFSTAERVTAVSGRGVGMDVVKRNIKSLRGNIQIESEEGKGATFRIQLPLTLAIIDGFRVEVAGMSYVLPLDMVTECVEVSVRDLAGKDGGNFLNLRGEVLPFLRMRDFFREGDNEAGRENVVVVEYARHKAGLVVDRLLGEFQTVIKPLGKVYSQIPWLSGATILGNGDISFILDVPMLIQFVKNQTAGSER